MTTTCPAFESLLSANTAANQNRDSGPYVWLHDLHKLTTRCHAEVSGNKCSSGNSAGWRLSGVKLSHLAEESVIIQVGVFVSVSMLPPSGETENNTE